MLTVHKKQNPARIMFTVPNGDDDPARNVQWYQLDGLSSAEAFKAATNDRARLYAIGAGIASITMDRFTDEEVARLVAAYAELVGAGG